MSRPDRTTRRLATTLLAAVTCLACPAIASTSESDRLSDAAKETAKPPAEQRPLRGNEDHGDRGGSVIISIAEPQPRPATTTPEPWNLFEDIHVGTVVMVSSLSSPDFAPATLYGLRVGTTDWGRTMVDVTLLGGAMRFARGSDIATVFIAPHEYGIDGSVRYSLTPAYATFGIAPVVGFRVGVLTWRYLNGIQVDRGGGLRTVTGDRLRHYTPYLGLAMTFLRSRHLELGATALGGWRYYDGETHDGLENDLFGDDRFRELRLESRIMF